MDEAPEISKKLEVAPVIQNWQRQALDWRAACDFYETLENNLPP